MKPKYAILIVLAALALVGLRIYFIQRERDSFTMKSRYAAPPPVTDDELVKVRRIYPVTLADVRALIGKPLWPSTPGQFAYFPYAGHRADYMHCSGYLRAIDQINVTDVVAQVAPHVAAERIPTGSSQVLLVFTFPNDAAKIFAVPVGYVQNGYNLFLDDYFFYDDPHQMYHWSPEIWAAVDQHREIAGMNELQSRLSVGPVTSVDSNDVGNRIVGFANNNNGKPLTVTFEHDKAVKIEGEK